MGESNAARVPNSDLRRRLNTKQGFLPNAVQFMISIRRAVTSFSGIDTFHFKHFSGQIALLCVVFLGLDIDDIPRMKMLFDEANLQVKNKNYFLC